MGVVLWVVSGFLALVFLATGLTKLTQPRLKMAAGPMAWAADVTDGQFRTIGALEILGMLGLILPQALGIATWLSPLAAACLALMMVFATATHVRLGEMNRAALPLIVLVLALFVAVGRFALLTH